MDRNRRAFLSTGPSWLVFIISTAVYLVLLYLSQPFSTNDELAFEVMVGGFALVAAGTIIIDTSCIWLKISERGHYYVQLLAGLVVVAVSLALPWILPRPVYHHRWLFVAFSGFFLGFYTVLLGWMRLHGLKLSRRQHQAETGQLHAGKPGAVSGRQSDAGPAPGTGQEPS